MFLISDHPFVRETESDRDQSRIERSHYLTCGGFGGPRARLESIMGSEKMNMFGTQNLRNAMVVGDISPMPHARELRARSEALEKEKDLYKSRAIAEYKQRTQLLILETQKKEELLFKQEQEKYRQTESERSNRQRPPATFQSQPKGNNQAREALDEEKDKKRMNDASFDALNEGKSLDYNDISTVQGGQSYLYGSNEMDSIAYENPIDPVAKLNFSVISSHLEDDRSLDVSANNLLNERNTKETAAATRTNIAEKEAINRDLSDSFLDENNYTADADFESESSGSDSFIKEAADNTAEQINGDQANSFLADAEEVGEDVDMVVGLDISILNNSINRRQTERSKINEVADDSNNLATGSRLSDRLEATTIIRKQQNSAVSASEANRKDRDLYSYPEAQYNFPSTEITVFFQQLAQSARSFAATKSPSDRKQLLSSASKRAFGSTIDILFNSFSTMWQNHLQTTDYHHQNSDLIVNPSVLASTLLDAMAVLELALASSLPMIDDLCSHRFDGMTRNFSDEQSWLSFSALNLIANCCKAVQAFLNLCEGLLKHMMQNDYHLLSKKMPNAEPAWTKVLSGCAGLLGLFILIPIEEELFSSSSLKYFVDSYRASVGAELENGSIIGLSVSDR